VIFAGLVAVAEAPFVTGRAGSAGLADSVAPPDLAVVAAFAAIGALAGLSVLAGLAGLAALAALSALRSLVVPPAFAATGAFAALPLRAGLRGCAALPDLAVVAARAVCSAAFAALSALRSLVVPPAFAAAGVFADLPLRAGPDGFAALPDLAVVAVRAACPAALVALASLVVSPVFVAFAACADLLLRAGLAAFAALSDLAVVAVRAACLAGLSALATLPGLAVPAAFAASGALMALPVLAGLAGSARLGCLAGAGDLESFVGLAGFGVFIRRAFYRRRFGRLAGMLRRLLSGLGVVAYALLVFVAFLAASYFAFSFFVRSGVLAVPDVAGLSRADAADLLADLGLTLRRADGGGRYDDKIAAGRIVRQNPDPHTLVKRGSSVEVVLSLGPRRVKVPDLSGKALPAAQVTLSAIGLDVGSIQGAFDSRKAPGAVMEQEPGAGDEVPPASPVNLLLAMATPGRRYLMPDLVYRHYDPVKQFFEARGFRFGSVKFERYEGVASGVILRQFPLPGHPLTANDPVSLVVATADGGT
jgi:beta-lactam-binding protein with PASTA domain